MSRAEQRHWRQQHLGDYEAYQLAVREYNSRMGRGTEEPDTPPRVLDRQRTLELLSAAAESPSCQWRDRITALQTVIHLQGWRPAAEPAPVLTDLAGQQVPARQAAALTDAMREIERLKSLSDRVAPQQVVTQDVPQVHTT